MKEPLKQEIRHILLGYIDYDQEERLVAAERTRRLRLLGLFNGTGAAGVFGVAVRKRRYSITGEDADIEADCRVAFADLGRRVALDAAPELAAVFYSPLLYNPSILTAACSGGVLEICVYTARTLTIRLNTSHAFRKWKQLMPGELREKMVEGEIKKEKNKKRQKTRLRREQYIPPDFEDPETDDDEP